MHVVRSISVILMCFATTVTMFRNRRRRKAGLEPHAISTALFACMLIFGALAILGAMTSNF